MHDSDYSDFEDISYAAYFTDPTTNRTEQRRFDIRVTKEPVHVYVRQIGDDYYVNGALPFGLYISTFYADGSPARCKVNVRVRKEAEQQDHGSTVATLRTNRYGLAKVTGARLPSQFSDESGLALVISAADSRGLAGTKTKEFSNTDTERILVETDKTLYRQGEPITAVITSTLKNEKIVVDLARNWSVIRSEQIKLSDGRATITFPYDSNFKDQLTLAAYADFPDTQSLIATQTILYPRPTELNVNVQTSQVSYRPGEDAQVSLRVRAPEARSLESALGVVVFDKAVEERSRTDEEFGNRFFSFNDTLHRFMGWDHQIAGVTLKDIQQTDMSKPVSPEWDLVAEILLNQNREYYPNFHGGDSYDTDQAQVFGPAITEELKPLRDVLTGRYLASAEYPKDDESLCRLLLDSKIDFNSMRDPWGNQYRATFSIDKQSDIVVLRSAGADKRFGTDDDFSVERFSWPYFRPTGQLIDRVAGQYHTRTRGFIRDLDTLRRELAKEEFVLDHLRDRWNKPYRVSFHVKETLFLINVESSGPDGRFSTGERESSDDFHIWSSAIDYFAEARAAIEHTLAQRLKDSGRFPQNETELSETLRASETPLESLRDAWGRPYYTSFKIKSFYADRVRIENRGTFGSTPTQRTDITPITQTASIISLRSNGPDGMTGTADDFDAATFTGVFAEQTGTQSTPSVVNTKTVLATGTGGMTGILTDPNGAVIPRVTVTATHSTNSWIYETMTGEDGSYTFAGLPPGLYEVQFSAGGFVKTIIKDVLVRASTIVQVNATLTVGAASETVTVTSTAAAIVESTSASVNSARNYTATRVITKSGNSQLSTPRLREYFPETLVWQPSIETDAKGRARLNFKLADNITTWKMSVIASTEDGRIGTVEKEFKAFQPFFVEHDPPRVLTEGDEISLPVVVRNYLERTQQVDLEIKPEQWFTLLGAARKRMWCQPAMQCARRLICVRLRQ